MSDLTATIQRVLDLDKQATGGPWESAAAKQGNRNGTITTVEMFVRREGGDVSIAAEVLDPETCKPSEANADLIAEYRTDAPDLARALVAEQGRVADLERQFAASRKAGEEMRAMYMRKAAVVDGLDAQLAEANARADAAEANVILWRGQTQQADADLARVTARAERAEATIEAALTACGPGDEAVFALAPLDDIIGGIVDMRENAESDLAAARQDAEALRAQVATLTVERDDAMARAERFAKYVDAVAPLSAPPAPVAAPDLADLLREAADALAEAIDRSPDPAGAGLRTLNKIDTALAAHNRQRLAGVK